MQLAQRYQESFFLSVVLPRYLSRHSMGPAPPPPPSPAHFDNVASASCPIARPASYGDDDHKRLWVDLLGRSKDAPRHAAPTAYDLSFFSAAHIKRTSPWRKVCDHGVGADDILQLYSDGKCSAELHFHRKSHAGPAVSEPLDVALVPLVRPQFFIEATAKDGSETLLLCVAHPFERHLVETPRSSEFHLHKPRKLADSSVLVPVASFLRPLRHYPYLEAAPPRAWTAAMPDVPVPPDSPQTAHTWLLSTKIDW